MNGTQEKKPFNAGIQKACPCCEGIMLLFNDDSEVFNTFICPNCGLQLQFHNRKTVDRWLMQQ